MTTKTSLLARPPLQSRFYNLILPQGHLRPGHIFHCVSQRLQAVRHLISLSQAPVNPIDLLRRKVAFHSIFPQRQITPHVLHGIIPARTQVGMGTRIQELMGQKYVPDLGLMVHLLNKGIRITIILVSLAFLQLPAVNNIITVPDIHRPTHRTTGLITSRMGHHTIIPAPITQ